MIRRMLVPLDGSELAEGVLTQVKDLARSLHARIHLVRTYDVSDEEIIDLGREASTDPTGAVEAMRRAEKDGRREAEHYLSGVAHRLRGEDIEASWKVVQGRAADKIVGLARSEKADLIAMSTHGRTGLDRVVFGSVAEEVLRSVGIPVLLVRPKLKGDQEQE